jgi:hypothetical protein
MSLFCSKEDFDSYHHQTGEVCSYQDMKAEMLSYATDTDFADWLPLDLDVSWLDLPSIDWSSIFDITL